MAKKFSIGGPDPVYASTSSSVDETPRPYPPVSQAFNIPKHIQASRRVPDYGAKQHMTKTQSHTAKLHQVFEYGPSRSLKRADIACEQFNRALAKTRSRDSHIQSISISDNRGA